MLTPAEASTAIGAALVPLPVETLALDAATGRILAETVVAERDLPPFDRVAMDGIAIRHAGWVAGIRRFIVDGVVGAGSEPPPLTADDHCLEVMTGAMLPPGANSVIPVELLRLADGHALLGNEVLTAGANVHHQATDGRAGEIALPRGTRLRGPELAVAASVGRRTVEVARAPGIAIISTGDELVGPDAVLKPWQIRRSNAQGIAALLRSRGHHNLRDAHIGDQRETLHQQIGQLLESQDVLILSGGVSAGRFDHVPSVLVQLGVRQVFHKVAQRPGKPLWFGVGPKGQSVFALPGNPVSTLVCLVRYVLPALEQLGGAAGSRTAGAVLETGWTGHATLTTFVPVMRTASGSPTVRLHQTRGSGDFISLVDTEGFVELAPGTTLPPGSPVPFYTW
ncbi:MAG: molybdopterin molybdotransferase MoeA [Pseudomonadota bacterium]|jgi:molybdopterin molybdotransferase